ncbi:MAG TPA: hypothetical protein VNT60_02745 [Deinococcales bacterium]|nr:hypothetical protein [Deinococcales bacterium]
MLAEAGVPHACLDIDTLRFAYPAPASDPFNLALGFRNLAAVWRNFQAAGALRLVCADVIEDRATLREYERAIPGLRVTVARLRAPVDVLQERLRGREKGAALQWHLDRAPVLAAQMDRDALEDVLVETEARSLREIALEVLARAGWPRP